jgi:hypothetical protein
VLAWARERWTCIVFNCTSSTRRGIAKAATDFRRLIDRAIELGGSYYLTYHRGPMRGNSSPAIRASRNSCRESGASIRRRLPE